MSLSTLLTLVRRQLLSKWGRTLISAMGIMIGVWAILLTVSLSQGVSEKLVTAVNSQSFARLLQFYQASDGSASFQEFDFENTRLVNTPYAALEEQETTLQEAGVEVSSSAVSDTMRLYLHPAGAEDLECVNTEAELAFFVAEGNPEEAEAQEQILDQCRELNTLLQPFDIFLENSTEENWYGSREEPAQNEIALCFVCNPENPVHEALGVEAPGDLVGQTITLEYKTLPNTDLAGSEYDLTNPEAALTGASLKQSVLRPYTVTAVYDDRESDPNNPFSALNRTAYVNYTQYLEAIAQQEPTLDPATLGYAEFNLFLESFEDLDTAVETLQDNNFLAFSLGQFLAGAIETAFQVVTIILGLFALIALVAAVFGIVNVMTISVLERQKEIGILKSLGSSNGDIFWIFLLESAALGVFGWLLGVLLTLLSNWGLSSLFTLLATSNEDVQGNLETLNISDFSLSIPLYALGLTLVLALFFTVLSGLFPSLRAARQNPTEVLREE